MKCQTNGCPKFGLDSKNPLFSIFPKFVWTSRRPWNLTLPILLHPLVGKQKARLTSWSRAFLLLQDIVKNCIFVFFHCNKIDFYQFLLCSFVCTIDDMT